MRMFTLDECRAWCRDAKVALDSRGWPMEDHDFPYRIRCLFPKSAGQYLWFSRCIESALQPREACLVWITNSGIFRSSENEHLYYRFRESYHDYRLLVEAPGHWCLEHERPEVVTLVQLSMLFGWDTHVIPSNGYGRAFICHDEWILIGLQERHEFDSTMKAFRDAKLEVSALPCEN